MKWDAAGSINRQVRAGSRVLSLFEVPLNTRILRAHADGPLRLAELHEKVGSPALATLRTALAALGNLGITGRLEVSRMPLAVATQLTPAGLELLLVADALERWLGKSPQGPIAIASSSARVPIKALAGAWGSTMMRELACEPASLTELSRQIPEMSYPSLERRLVRMRATQQVEAAPAEGRTQPFAATDWLRESIAPLCLAGRCERRHFRRSSGPIGPVEIETSLLLALPLAPLPETGTGVCVLSASADLEDPGGAKEEPQHAGVAVAIERGRVASCPPELRRTASAWARGSSSAWLDAVIEGRLEHLQLGGRQPQLAVDAVKGLHLALFDAGDEPARPSPVDTSSNTVTSKDKVKSPARLRQVS